MSINLKHALEAILALDPEKDSPEGMNEWGEADCFRKAQDIARIFLQANAMSVSIGQGPEMTIDMIANLNASVTNTH